MKGILSVKGGLRLFVMFMMSIVITACGVDKDKIAGDWTSMSDIDAVESYLTSVGFNNDGTGKLVTVATPIYGDTQYYEAHFTWDVDGYDVVVKGDYAQSYDYNSASKSVFSCRLKYDEGLLKAEEGIIPGIPYAYISPVFIRN